MMKKLLVFIHVLACISFAQSQDTIAFRLTPQNNLVVQTILNEKDTLNMMLHTGVSDISITEETARRVFEPDVGEAVNVQTWGGNEEAQYIPHNQLSIGAIRQDSLNLWVGKLSGQGTDGKFGPDFFEERIVEIDFDKKILVIHSALPYWVQKNAFSQWEIEFNRGMMFAKGEVRVGEKVYFHSFMIHSGYGGALLLDDVFAQKHKLGSYLTILSESQLRDSYGNVLKTKKALLPSFEMGGHEFADVPVSFFDGSLGRQKISVMGGALLKRFNLFLDLRQGHVYARPNGLMSLPFKEG